MRLIRGLRALVVGAALGSFVVFPAFSDPNLQVPGFRSVPGDFDGDGQTDALLQPLTSTQTGGVLLGQGDAAAIRVQDLPPSFLDLSWAEDDAQVHVGDFNADGQDDLLVQAVSAGRDHAILLANEAGQFLTRDHTLPSQYMGLDWSQDASRLAIGDFDGDGRADVLVQPVDPAQAVTVVLTDDLGSPAFGSQTWYDGFVERTWNAAEAQLFAGDFDGDGRADLLSRLTNDDLLQGVSPQPALAIMLAGPSGAFSQLNYTWERDELGAEWSPHTHDLLVEDVDGDGIADIVLIARSAKSGMNYLMLGTVKGKFQSVAARWKGSATAKEVYARSRQSFAQAVVAMQGVTQETRQPEVAKAVDKDQQIRMQSNSGGGTLVPGALEGSGGVSGGAASYSIPVVVAPGRAGMQPSVSVGYSSRAGNGALGMGWSLSAGSSISRCPQSTATDGQSIGVTFSADDRLCLDGQRLLATSGTYGTSNAVYRTEIDSFAVVTQTAGDLGSASGSEAARFTVEFRDGRKAFYGAGQYARFRGVKGDGTTLVTAHTWAVDRQEDRAGNNIIYTYARPRLGEHLLAEIAYTGRNTSTGDRRVVFHWEDRPDVSSSWLGEGRSWQTQRLSMISTHVAAAGAREYRFEYGAISAASKRSLLTAVEECAFNGATRYCLAPTQFTWQHGTVAFGAPNATGYSASGAPVPFARVSVPGEGTPVSVATAAYPGYRSPEYRVRTGSAFLGKGERETWVQAVLPTTPVTGTTSLLRLNTSGVAPVSAPAEGWPQIPREDLMTPFDNDREVDMNNDGRVDQLFADSATGNFSIRVGNFDAQGELTGWGKITTNVPHAGAVSLRAADFDGDAKIDFMLVRPKSSGSSDRAIYFHRNTTASTLVGAGGSMSFAAGVLVADPDEETVTIPGGPSYTTHATLSQVMDVDGDGRPDVIYSKFDIQPVPSQILVNRSLGGSVSFDESAPLTAYNLPNPQPTNPLNPPARQLWGDVNGDGLDDVMTLETGGWMVRFNKGGQFSEPQDVGLSYEAIMVCQGTACGDHQEPSGKVLGYFARLADIDNDGKADLLLPVERVATACLDGIVELDKEGEWVADTVCGNEIHNVEGLESYDSSIYRYRAFRLETTPAGTSVQPIGLEFFAPGDTLQVGDLDGDGLADLLWSAHRRFTSQYYASGCGAACSLNIPSYGVYVSHAQQAAPDLMLAAEDAFGRRNEWTYKTLSHGAREAGTATEPKLYEVDASAPWIDGDHFPFTSTMYVVKQFRRSNGVGGTNATNYGYRDAVFHNKGRGFQGFRQIIEVDLAAGLRSVTSFRQDFPFAGMVSEARVEPLPGYGSSVAFLSRTVNDYACGNTLTGGACDTNIPRHPRLAYLTQSETERFDPAGSQLARVTSTNLWNSAGIKNGCALESGSVTTNDGTASYTTTTVLTLDDQSGSNWFCKVDTKTVTASTTITAAPVPTIGGGNSQTRKVTYTYEPNFRTVATETVEPDTAALRRVTAYAYHLTGPAAGNLHTVTVHGGSGQTALTPRTTTTTYSDDGYFPKHITNALGQTVTVITSAVHGQPTASTDPNGITTSNTYDAFGRAATSAVSGNGLTLPQRVQVFYGGSGGGVLARYSVQTTQSGAPTQTTWYDMYGRVLRSETGGFESNPATVTTSAYDALGRVTAQTEPHFAGTANPPQTSIGGYDLLGRVTSKTDPSGVLFTNTYQGYLTTTTVSPPAMPSRTVSQRHDAAGRLVTSTDALGGSTRFRYDPWGNPVLIQDALGNQIKTVYNLLGQKTQVADPDQGTTDFVYNVAGELEWQRDAKQQVTEFDYDLLGRMERRVEMRANGSIQHEAVWNYGSNPAVFNVGQLASVIQYDGSASPGNQAYYEDYQYDGLSRPIKVTTQAGSDTYDTFTEYDGLGRVAKVAYPAGVNNQNPTAYAGIDQLVALGASVQLSGSGSDPDSGPQPLSYQWTQESGPSVTLVGANTTSPSFTAAQSGNYVFRLTVSDGRNSGSDTVSITSNGAPTVNAGVDFTVNAGATPPVVQLAGVVTDDGYLNSPPTYAWAQLAGPAVTLSNPAILNPTFTAPDGGTYGFQLTANDGQHSVSDSVNVTVNVSPPSGGMTASVTQPAADGSHSVSWTLPSNGGWITRVEVQVARNGGSFGTAYSLAPTATSQAIAPRPMGTYQYRVRACNAGGCGASADTSVVTVTRKPQSFSASATQSTSGSLSVNWGRPEGGMELLTMLDGMPLFWDSSKVDQYKVVRRFGTSGAWTDAASFGPTTFSGTVSNLPDGVHQLAVLACLGSACSVASPTASLTVARTPTNASASPNPVWKSGSSTLSWSAGASGGSGASFQVSRQDPGLGWNDSWASTSGTSQGIGSLPTPGTYNFRVRSCVSGLCSAWSGTAGLVVNDPPPPTLSAPSSAAFYTNQTVSITPPAGGPGGATYEVSRAVPGGTWVDGWATTTGTSVVTGNLDQVGTFQYRARTCVNGACGNQWSNTRSISVAAPLPPTGWPSGDSILQGGTIPVSWSAAAGAPAGATYRIGRQTPTLAYDDNWRNTTATSYTLTDLDFQGDYWFWLRACYPKAGGGEQCSTQTHNFVVTVTGSGGGGGGQQQLQSAPVTECEAQESKPNQGKSDQRGQGGKSGKEDDSSTECQEPASLEGATTGQSAPAQAPIGAVEAGPAFADAKPPARAVRVSNLAGRGGYRLMAPPRPYDLARQARTVQRTLNSRTLRAEIRQARAHKAGFNASLLMASFAGIPSAPGRFTVEYSYTANGYLKAVRNADTNALYWQADAVDARGALTNEVFGNGVRTLREYQPHSGRVEQIQSGLGTGGGVQYLTYGWSPLGHLEQRSDLNRNFTESFGYDSLDRMTSSQVTAGGVTAPVQSYAYNAVGNLTFKTGVGTYSYPAQGPGAVRPHAVTAVTGGALQTAASYTYDANGNMATRHGEALTWNVANLPTRIVKSSETAEFKYGPSRARYQQVAKYGSATETVTYIGSLYEKTVRGSETEHRFLIRAGSAQVAYVAEKKTASAWEVKTRYLHRDHLGSVDTITKPDGTVEEHLSFDAHGNRRVATDWKQVQSYASAIGYALRAKNERRGYTDHEMLDNVGLIHMNGRVYDPAIGRFLSVDPVFQFPENTQSLNPYSYVLNSPLSATDPTGYTQEDPTEQDNSSGKGNMESSTEKTGANSYRTTVGDCSSGCSETTQTLTKEGSGAASGAMGIAGGQSVGSVSINGQSIGLPGKGQSDRRSSESSPSDIGSIEERAAATIDAGAPSGAGMTVDFSGYLLNDSDRRNIDNTFTVDDLSDVDPTLEQALRTVWRAYRSVYSGMLGSGEYWDRVSAQAQMSQLNNYAQRLSTAGSIFATSGLSILAGSGRLPRDIAVTFRAEKYHTITLASDVVAYRYAGGGSQAAGRWLTTRQTVAQIRTGPDAVAALNLPAGATAAELHMFVIPAGTTVHVGRVAGGWERATQIFLPNPAVLRQVP